MLKEFYDKVYPKSFLMSHCLSPVLGSERDEDATDGESRHETLEDREFSSEGRPGGDDDVVLLDSLLERSRSRMSGKGGV